MSSIENGSMVVKNPNSYFLLALKIAFELEQNEYAKKNKIDICLRRVQFNLDVSHEFESSHKISIWMDEGNVGHFSFHYILISLGCRYALNS